jgi:hypothetical protein
MKRRPGETLEHCRHRISQIRSSNIYRHQRELAQQSGQGLEYTLSELRWIITVALGTNCPYSGEIITVRNFSLDHNLPLSREGSFHLSNLRVVSQRGNETKGKLTHEEFMRLLGALDTMETVAKQDVLRRMRAGSKMLRVFGFGKRKEKAVSDNRTSGGE